MKWTERWIVRAQHKADLRAERYRSRKASSGPPDRMDRAEAWVTASFGRFEAGVLLARANANERRISLPTAHQSLALAEEQRTWVTDGPIYGPDQVRVTISIVTQNLPFHDQARQSWPEPTESQQVHIVCIRRMPAGPVRKFCPFVTEVSAQWYAVELARLVRLGGITGLLPSDVFPERPRRADGAMAAEIMGLTSSGPRRRRLPRRRLPGDA